MYILILTLTSLLGSFKENSVPLPNCHLLAHLGLARGAYTADAGTGAWLLLEDLPEFQALISRCCRSS